MRKIVPFLTLNLTVVILILLLRMPSLGYQEPSSPECQVQKWDIPVSLTSTSNQKTPSAILIQRLPITCCQNDTSCLDEVLYQGEKGQLPNKKSLLTAINRSLQYLQTTNADAAYKKYK